MSSDWRIDELAEEIEEEPSKHATSPGQAGSETTQQEPAQNQGPKDQQSPTETKILKDVAPEKVMYRWKIVVCGPGGVGKTTLLHRYFYKTFLSDTVMTIGVVHMSHFIERHGKIINLIIWDLSGQKRFEVLHPAYIGDANGAFVVFDMSVPETLDEVNHWVELIRKYNSKNPNMPIVIVGTKIDLLDQSKLDEIYERIEQKMAELELQYVCATSSKTGVNVNETIDFLVDFILYSANLI
jgi:small GTP-binding protein